MGGATSTTGETRNMDRFQSTLPVGGATSKRCANPITTSNFNPRSPWGERLLLETPAATAPLFQSTLPVGGATPEFRGYKAEQEFQSTLPVGGATGVEIETYRPKVFQSTLPVGGATLYVRRIYSVIHISIHAPRGGSDFCKKVIRPLYVTFQSPLPVGGATCKSAGRVR